MTQVTLADTLVYACKKTGKNYDLPVSTWTADVLQAVIVAGISRYFTDVHASVTKANDGDKMAANADALIVKKIAALNAGEIRAARESHVDPLDMESFKVALAAVQGSDAFKSWLLANKAVATKGEGLDHLRTQAKELAKRDDVRKVAQQRLDLIAGLSGIKL